MCTRKEYPVLMKEKILRHVTPCMHLERLRLKEISLLQKNSWFIASWMRFPKQPTSDQKTAGWWESEAKGRKEALLFSRLSYGADR